MCTFANYADDIIGTIVGMKHVGQFLQAVEHHMGKLHQHISRDKSRVVVVSKHSHPTPSHIAGVPASKEMRVLGTHFYSNHNLWGNVGRRCAMTNTTVNGIHARSHEEGCSRDPVVMLHLLDHQVRPRLLFGSAIWGPHLSRQGADAWLHEPFRHPLQVPFNTLLRSALGVAPKTGTWMCLMLSGHLPVVDYMALDFVRFWNSLVMLAGDHQLLRACISTQIHLLESRMDCWLTKWVGGPAHCLGARGQGG